MKRKSGKVSARAEMENKRVLRMLDALGVPVEALSEKDSGDSEERPRRYKSALEELRHELRELWGTGAYERGDRLPATPSREECRQLMSAYTSGKWAFRNNLIVRVLYASGMRGEELENLKVCDVNYDEPQNLFVRGGKGDKDRYTCADEETFRLIRQWCGEQGKGLADPVIGLSARQIRRVVEGAGEITGISEKYEAMGRVFSSHSMRHAFATHCYENGIRILTLKKLMGHEFLATTEIYLYTAMKFDVEEYRRTGPLREGMAGR